MGDEAKRGVAALKPGEVAVLENLRYHSGEEKNDMVFAGALAELGDLYVDDAFSSSHRAHASVEGITHLLPSYAGLLMMAEIKALDRALEHPARPVMAIVGGAKVSTKIRGSDQPDGAHGPARSWPAAWPTPSSIAQGVEIGTSLCQPDAVPDRQGDHGARPRAQIARSSCPTTSWWPRSLGPASSGMSARSGIFLADQ